MEIKTKNDGKGKYQSFEADIDESRFESGFHYSVQINGLGENEAEALESCKDGIKLLMKDLINLLKRGGEEMPSDEQGIDRLFTKIQDAISQGRKIYLNAHTIEPGIFYHDEIISVGKKNDTWHYNLAGSGGEFVIDIRPRTVLISFDAPL